VYEAHVTETTPRPIIFTNTCLRLGVGHGYDLVVLLLGHNRFLHADHFGLDYLVEVAHVLDAANNPLFVSRFASAPYVVGTWAQVWHELGYLEETGANLGTPLEVALDSFVSNCIGN